MTTLSQVPTQESMRVSEQSYHELNAMLNLWGTDGKIQFSKDKEAARQFFLQHVNRKLYTTYSLEEKLNYLFDNDYYERAVFDQYPFEFVKNLYKRVYAAKPRFSTFLGAFKFYTSYALKTFDGEAYLERYEDRITVSALYLAQGDQSLAESIADIMVSGAYQPATPTFLNAGKAQRGELVSCFPAGSLVDTADGLTPIEDIVEGDLVLSHDGAFHAVSGTMSRTEVDGLVTIRVAGSLPLTLTPEHPVLVLSEKTSIPELDGKDGASGRLRWIAAKDVRKGDFVVSSTVEGKAAPSELRLLDYVSQPDVFEEVNGSILRLNRDSRLRSVPTGKYSKTHKPVTATVVLDESFGRFLGYYLAEGHVAVHRRKGSAERKSGVVFTFGSHETEFIEDVIALGKDIFGLDAASFPSRNDGSTNVVFNSGVLAEFFSALVGTGFGAKSLPVSLRAASDEFRIGLLVGVYRGDGCTTGSGLTASLVNPGLVYQLRQVALSVGLLARTRVFDNAAGNRTANVDITGFPGNEWEFVMKVAKNTEKFQGANPLYSGVSQWVEGKPVFRVEETSFAAGEVTVFNLEVEDTHTYVVEGHVVHNCFLLRMEDNMESISRSINAALQLSKRGGGVAFALTNLREAGAPIKKIENQSSGVVPVMKLFEDSFSYANQLGARQGAGAVYLHANHPDIERFLDTKRENADEKVRIKTLSLGVVVPNIAFELARNDEEMYLFSPYDVERIYGKPFSDISVTEKYREMVDDPRIRKSKFRGKARGFFQMLAELQFESGYPYIMYEDTVNDANPIAGRIIQSNLCSEILQVSTASSYRENLGYQHIGRDISCNLGSLNIAATMDYGDLEKVVDASVRALTAVSDMSNIESVPSIAKGNDASHAIGLGQMNLHGFLGRERIHYGSEESLDFVSSYFAAVAFYAIKTSNKLAIERGTKFADFEKSKYADGSFFDKYTTRSWAPKTDAAKAVFKKHHIKLPSKADWAALKESVMEHGIYNAYLQAVPPTGSISYINGSTSSIHPITSKVEIRKEGKLGRVYYPAPGMNNDNLEFFEDAYELGYEKVIDVYAAATEHVDQGLSLTLFFKDTATTRDINRAQIYAWKKGIKTIYYIRLRQMALEGTDVSECVSCML